MKKMFFALMMLATTISAKAMSYEQARNEALFLTDKMAYELNLTEEQYEAAYEINLDYLMGVTGRTDVFGTYWERRNLDLSYILFDWQWNAFVAASYFYRPLYWEAGYWHFGIYLRYPHRDYFYFGRPHFYATYRGGHAWHRHGAHGYYHGHSNHYRGHHGDHVGMHDRWNRGDFRGPRNSSTRVTGSRHGDRDHRDGRNGNFNGRRDGRSNGSLNNHQGPSSNRQTAPQSRINTQNRINTQSRTGSPSRISNHNRVTDRGRSVEMSGSRNSSSHSGGSRGGFSGGTRSGGSHGSSSHGGFSGGSRGGGSHGGGSHGGGSHGGGSHGHGGHR